MEAVPSDSNAEGREDALKCPAVAQKQATAHSAAAVGRPRSTMLFSCANSPVFFKKTFVLLESKDLCRGDSEVEESRRRIARGRALRICA